MNWEDLDIRNAQLRAAINTQPRTRRRHDEPPASPPARVSKPATPIHELKRFALGDTRPSDPEVFCKRCGAHKSEQLDHIAEQGGQTWSTVPCACRTKETRHV